MSTAGMSAGATYELKKQKLWEAAYAPGTSIAMTTFMMWMSGNDVQIFRCAVPPIPSTQVPPSAPLCPPPLPPVPLSPNYALYPRP